VSRLKGQQNQVRCHTCKHPRRVEMERLIARGASIPKVAEKFAVNSFALRRHMQSHVSPEARAEYLVGATADTLGELVIEENTSVLTHYAGIRSRLYRHLDAAGEANDRLNIDRLAGRLHENLHHVSRITGELQRSPLLVQQNNFLSHPDTARTIAAIVSAVAPFPEARIAVVQALRRLERTDQPALEHSGAE
jgi:hypothetical protein